MKKKDTQRETELDRIIAEGEDVLDLDYYKWIICFLHKKNNIKRLKRCTKANWEHDKIFWGQLFPLED